MQRDEGEGKTFFKLVRRDRRRDRPTSWHEGKTLLSAFTHGNYEVEYIPGLWVRGEFPLFIFDTLENARKFVPPNCYDAQRFELWECEAVNARPQAGKLASGAGRAGYPLYWKTGQGPIAKTPEGTYIADEVKLTRIVSTGYLI